MSNGNPGNWIIPWRDPKEVIQEGIDRAIARLIDNALQQVELRNLAVAESVKCPKRKKVKVSLQYLHADGSPVTEAKYILFGENDDQLSADSLTAQGVIEVEVLEDDFYNYYFHEDYASKGDRYFGLFDAGTCVANPVTNLGQGFTEALIERGTLAIRTLGGAHAQLGSQADFAAFPTFGKLLHGVIANNTAHVLPDLTKRQERLAATIELVLALFRQYNIAKKEDRVEAPKMWEALVFERLACSLGLQSVLISDLLYHLSQGKKAPSVPDLLALLNSRGKCNGIKWLRALKADFPKHANAVATSIETICQQVETELQKLKSAPDAKVSKASRTRLDLMLKPVAEIRTAVTEEVAAVMKRCADAFPDIPKGVMKYERLALAGAPNKLQQKSAPLGAWTLVSKTTWLEVQYEYADGTPVPGAEYIVQEKSAKVPFAEGLLSLEGKAKVEVPDGKSYTFSFRRDPPFTLLPANLVPPRAIAVDDDILTEVIADATLNAAVLEWGDADFSGKDDFKLAPSLRKLAHWAVQKQSLLAIPARDESELIEILYPVLLNPVKVIRPLPVWPALVMCRCSCSWPDGSGAVRQGILQYLAATATDIHLIDLVKMLNSVGQGNAVRWLEKLLEEWPTDLLVQDITGILQRIAQACGTIAAADVALVSEDNRSYAAYLKTSVESVIGNVQALVEESLKPAKDKLTQALTEKLEYAKDATLLATASHRQESAPFPDRLAAAPPAKLKWLDVQYLYADGKPVPSAQVALSGGGEPTPPNKPKAGLDGFKHIVYPDAKMFDTFRFLHDPPYVLADPFKCIANANKASSIPALLNHASKPLGHGKKVLKFAASTPAFATQQDYNNDPTISKIVFNRVRGRVEHVPQSIEIEKEIARAITYQLMAADPRDWSGLAFLWLMTRRTAEGHLISAVLGAIYRHRIRNAAANPPLLDIVKIMNALGKGNAVRWLEDIQGQGDAMGEDVSQSLQALLLEIREDLLALGNPTGSDAVKKQFCSEVNQAFAKAITNRLSKVQAEAAGPAAKACITAACTGVGQLLALANNGQLLYPTPIQLYRRNVVRQEAELPTSEALKAPPWLALQYQHHDTVSVRDASYVVKLQGAATIVSQGRLSSEGFVYIPNPPLGVTLEYYFRDESSADNLFKIDADFQSQARDPVAPSIQTDAARGVGGRNFWQFQPPESRRFEWGEGNTVRVPTPEQFGAGPSIGKVAWWAAARNSPRTTGANPSLLPDIDEMASLLRALVEGGTGGVAAVPAWFTADNAEQSARLWTSVALNRVGVTVGVNAMKPEDGLVRRAILEHLEFEIDLAALLPANHVNEVKPLVALLNKIGKGPALKWLRLLKTELDNLRDQVRDNIHATLDLFRDELQDLHDTFVPLRPMLLPYRQRIPVVSAEVQNQIEAVFQGFADKLNLMVPAAVVRPYVSTGTLRKINVFKQPVADFPQCQRGRSVPTPWHLADPAPILVGYEHSDGTPVPSATFILYQKGGAQVATLNAQPGRATFNVAAASGEYEFSYELDAGVAGLNARALPWANPYVVLDNANPAGTYLTAAANGNRFAGLNNLPWGDASIQAVGAFNAGPTLNRILADCVIDGCPHVSSSSDIRDLVMVLSGMLQSPARRNVAEEWFKLGAALLGTIQPNGAVQKGILVYAYNNSLPNARTLLDLMNWAGKLHAVHWLEDEVVARNYLVAVENALTAILNRFKQNLNMIWAVANDAQVSPALRAFLNDPVISSSDSVIALANANFATCFDTAVNRVDTVLQNANFPWKQPCGPGRAIYRQREADDFLECGNPLTGVRKGVLINAANTAIGNGTAFGGVDPDRLVELNAFNAPVATRGMAAKQLAQDFAKMNDAEFQVRFNQLKTEPGWTVNSQNIIEHTDGTLIRYKPNGDDHQRPPCPTYSVEVVKEHYVGGPYDPPLNRAAFKVDAQGRAVPKNPAEVNVPGAAANAVERAYYKDLMMKSGHKSLLF